MRFAPLNLSIYLRPCIYIFYFNITIVIIHTNTLTNRHNWQFIPHWRISYLWSVYTKQYSWKTIFNINSVLICLHINKLSQVPRRVVYEIGTFQIYAYSKADNYLSSNHEGVRHNAIDTCIIAQYIFSLNRRKNLFSRLRV